MRSCLAPDRAAASERAVRQRFLRRLWAFPGTRLGAITWPTRWSHRFFLGWHYWWQAHLLDCLVDAQLRDPSAERAKVASAFVRGALIRNGFGFTNRYYDDMAWWALALHRAEEVFGRRFPIEPILRASLDAIRPDGVLPWRFGDNFINAPANGPVAILLARCGFHDQARDITEWIYHHLLLDNGLIADGAREVNGELKLDDTIYSYCQGVVLGAELEAPGPESQVRIAELTKAIAEKLTVNGVLKGHDGHDGGLFTGILVRYLAMVAARADDAPTRDLARQLVSTSAEIAWDNAIDPGDGLPLFGHEWIQPAIQPTGGRSRRIEGGVVPSAVAERDLSVQLSGWMLMEAAATLPQE